MAIGNKEVRVDDVIKKVPVQFSQNVIDVSEDVNFNYDDDLNVIDKDWITNRFIVPDNELDELDATNRYFTTNSWKFTNTQIGGNIGINPRPQFTRYADIRNSNRTVTNEVTLNNNAGNYGKSIDYTAQIIFLTFGVAKFNTLLDTVTRAIDYTDSYIANYGRTPIGYELGQIIGKVLIYMAFPLITITIWSIQAVSKLLIGNKPFNYYYLEPSMHLYWGIVNILVTQFATEEGILIPEFLNDGSEADRIGIATKFNQDDIDALKEILPGIIGNNNYIDVYAIATRAQTIANQQLLKERELYERGEYSEFDMVGYVKEANSVKESKSPGASKVDALNKTFSFQNFLDKLTKNDGLFAKEDESEGSSEPPEDGKFTKNPDGSYPIKTSKEKESYLDRLVKAIDSGIKDGGLHAVFYVDYSGEVSESFSNSYSEINIGEKIKNVAQGARDVRFDLAGGNISKPIDKLLDVTKNVLSGVLDSATFGLSSVVSTLTGGGYVDLPKKWDDSSSSLPSVKYTIQLRSPYGNVFSRLQNIWIPYFMLLGGVLPIATGKSSYTSPLLCDLFSKGERIIDLGMITELSVSRATTNLGYNKDRKPLGLDVSFTITDFSSRLAAPVDKSLFSFFNTSLNDDSVLGNYIATLGSRGLLTNKYAVPKIKLRASRLLMQKEQMVSPAAWGLRFGEVLSGVVGGVVADHSLTLNK
jgi:hypothetical protein